MIKEKKYLIKAINYNIDTNPEDNKNSISSAKYQDKNMIINNNYNNFINPSIDVKKYNNINLFKEYNGLKSLEPNKKLFNSFSEDVELSFEKNNTLLNETNCYLNNEKIYKKIFEKYRKKKEELSPVKISKIKKTENKPYKGRVFQDNIKTNNHTFFETKLKNKKNLYLKTDGINNKNNDYKLKISINGCDNKNITCTFENDISTPILSNKKDENQIFINHSILLKARKNKEISKKKNEKENKIKKNVNVKRNNNRNNELTIKIENKGYFDSTDFMNVINEEINIKKNRKNESSIKKKKDKYNNKIKKIMDKKIIEVLNNINIYENKKKIKEKEILFENLDSKMNVNKNDINKRFIINENKRYISNNTNFNQDVGKLKKKLNSENFTDKNINNNIFQSNKKTHKLERDNYKLPRFKMNFGQHENESEKILENITNRDKTNNDNNKLKKDQELKEGLQKNNLMNKTSKNSFLNTHLLSNKNFENNINDAKMIQTSKNRKNIVLISEKKGINLTNKIKKYYSIQNKTIEYINNKNLTNILYNRNNKDNINNNKDNFDKNYEINKLNHTTINNSNIMNIYNERKNDININNHQKFFSNNFIIQNLCFNDNEKPNNPLKNQVDAKQNMNLTTRDETFKTYNNNSKDIENIDITNLTKESVKDNNQVKSSDSQIISGINGQNTTYFSGFNKSDLKMLNKVNLDMPVNIDLDKEENEEEIIKEKEESKNLIEKEINNSSPNKRIENGSQDKDEKLEILESFINKFNNDKNEIQDLKENNFNNVIPSNGKTDSDINLIINEKKDNNDNMNNIKEEEINSEKLKIKNIKLNDTKVKSNFYDDINIINKSEDEINKIIYNNNSIKKLNFSDINIDIPNNDQDFLNNVELIQKNNFRLVLPNEIKNDETKNNTEMETIKDIETEYEFNLEESKFCKPLRKYSNKINFDKINPF